MDRGHRAFLVVAAILWNGVALDLSAAPPPAAATPSVQASPGQRPMPGPPLNPAPATVPEPGPLGHVKAAMMEAREHELNDTAAANRLARMSPEERDNFKRNLKVWQGMPQDERMALRKQANERNREEVLGALRESGLQLSDDQREVFALRYLQERRKLERELLEQANTERAHRLPQILQGLKREFTADKSTATPAVSASPAAH